jgi:RNA polymerase sigma-70 factor (ECF subfamily)
MDSPSHSTSLTLLERVRNRDDEAWRRLLHLYSPLVLHWCKQRNVRGQDAEDVMQDVFEAVSNGLDGFRRDRPGDTFRGWLHGITRNKLRDYFRRLGKQPHAIGGSAGQRQLQEIAEQDTPEDSPDVLGALYRRALELVRAEFEPRTWEAFWRSAIDGHTTAVIAADLGVSAAAVRKSKSRVLHRLRQEVGDLLD